jgi:hypothetical protein
MLHLVALNVKKATFVVEANEKEMFLMPNIIQRLKDAYSTGQYAEIIKTLLPELFQAADEGKIVALPCNFYSEVYALTQVGKEIIHGELRSTNKDYCLIINWEGNLTSKGKTWSGVQVRNKEVFLTREAAEAALKKREP